MCALSAAKVEIKSQKKKYLILNSKEHKANNTYIVFNQFSSRYLRWQLEAQRLHSEKPKWAD